jgi:hypothetical protein
LSEALGEDGALGGPPHKSHKMESLLKYFLQSFPTNPSR